MQNSDYWFWLVITNYVKKKKRLRKSSQLYVPSDQSMNPLICKKFMLRIQSVAQ